jgi:Cft2 family RNA processing exonuclease
MLSENGYRAGVAQRTRPRFPEPKKAPDWVPVELLERIGLLVGDDAFAEDARRTPLLWPERLDALIDHAGGSVPPAELADPLDELEERYGIARVALTMLRIGMPVAQARPAVNRFLEGDGLAPLPDRRADLSPAGRAPESLERVVRERDRLAEELHRERERTKEKDRKLREERAAHALSRSELTSDRDKARHAAREAERQMAAGPSGAVLEELRLAREAAEVDAEAARTEADRARGAEEAARADLRRAQAALGDAQGKIVDAAAELARRAAEPPSTTDLVRAARHVGTAALLRLESPAAGDAELLEAIAAITRWYTARSGITQPRGTASAAPALLPPPPDPAEPSAVEPAPAERTRAGRARAAARAIGGPLKLTIAGGGGIGSSAYLVEWGGKRLLLDCGIGGSGRHAELPSDLDAVILSHAHGDHMGGLPELLRRQPELRIYCSKPTKLLTTFQANAAEEWIPGDRILVRDPGETYRILDGAVELTLHRVAHILGSCAVRLRFADGRVLVYSGDLGGGGLRTLRPAEPLPLGGASAVLLEATLGDRATITAADRAEVVETARAVIEDGGCCVFPAANIGRAQELAAMLGEGFADGSLPEAPVWMTPLGRRVLDRYRAGDRDGWLSDAPYPAVETLRPDEPADVVVARTGYVIVGGAAAVERRSGQLAFAAAQRAQCGVFFTGYSGPTARQHTGDTLETLGEDGFPQRTEILCRWVWAPSPDHASQRELVAAVAHLDPRTPLLLVHGVEEAKRQLALRLREAGHLDVRPLSDGNVVELQ